MMYAIFTPTNDSSTPPSMQYSYVGPENPSHELEGSICTAVAFDSREDFDRFISEADQDFWERR